MGVDKEILYEDDQLDVIQERSGYLGTFSLLFIFHVFLSMKMYYASTLTEFKFLLFNENRLNFGVGVITLGGISVSASIIGILIHLREKRALAWWKDTGLAIVCPACGQREEILCGKIL